VDAERVETPGRHHDDGSEHKHEISAAQEYASAVETGVCKGMREN
jgi:hypothetical protein